MIPRNTLRNSSSVLFILLVLLTRVHQAKARQQGCYDNAAFVSCYSPRGCPSSSHSNEEKRIRIIPQQGKLSMANNNAKGRPAVAANSADEDLQLTLKLIMEKHKDDDDDDADTFVALEGGESSKTRVNKKDKSDNNTTPTQRKSLRKQLRQWWKKKNNNQKRNGNNSDAIQEITTLKELDRAFHGVTPDTGDSVLKSISVKGDTQMVTSDHPVARLLYERQQKRQNNKETNVNNKNSNKDDGYKIALAIEGGGMRGCVSAGMVTALHYLGLEDCFDVVYGSSAGSLIGAYFITRQVPWLGPEIYYDSLTTAGKTFIDTNRLLRALGLGLLDPRLYKDVLFRRGCGGKPVLNLHYLLETTVQRNKPLDWNKFVDMQTIQPLKVIASGLKSERAVVFDMAGEKKSFRKLKELGHCMHASMLLPGIAGAIMNIGPITTTNTKNSINDNNRYVIANDYDSKKKEQDVGFDVEPLADALIYEPIPYKSALAEGATHVVVLRTRPDGVDVTGKPGIFDKLIIKRFFVRKNNLPNIYKRMRKQEHKRIYAESVLELNRHATTATTTTENDNDNNHNLLAVALPPGSPEVTRLETGRRAILEGVRRGFARAYDALVYDPNERGRGTIVAKEVFPDEILDYNPVDYYDKEEVSSSSSSSSSLSKNEIDYNLSAFEMYLRETYPSHVVEEFIQKAEGTQHNRAI